MRIDKLKVNKQKVIAATPCTIEMASLMSCWATRGIDDRHCSTVAKSLIDCMNQPKAPARRANNINYHLARLGKFVL
ncbi:hypothetical protein IWQ60_006432 [Tieghemiomyces parasiticus]|uniref:37S ribosomal protein mrp10, mitochondrial n=1 Tax=Tieghemiomyces parasiticus TaxID=78921 RepID=A0A9W8DXL1_9FUNG|nr:hypothetical protein IWQ60_006432 [Tieghemiomyces parasiticus]